MTGYQLFRDAASTVSPGNPAVYSGSATSCTDYPAAGTYYYAVRACNSAGCWATSTAGPVTVVAPATITSGSCSGTTCTFARTGAGPLKWTMGNGQTATGSPVSATYTAKGTFQVTLTDSQAPPTQASRTVTCTVVKRRLRCST